MVLHKHSSIAQTTIVFITSIHDVFETQFCGRAEQNGDLERHEVSKIEDHVQCQMCSRNPIFCKTVCGCGRVLHGIRQSNDRYVHDVHYLALKDTQRGSTSWKIGSVAKQLKKKYYLDSAQ